MDPETPAEVPAEPVVPVEPETAPSVPTGPVPEEVDMVKINQACFVLIMAMLPTNAETLEVVQHGFRVGEQVFGDYKVTVAKVPPIA